MIGYLLLPTADFKESWGHVGQESGCDCGVFQGVRVDGGSVDPKKEDLCAQTLFI